jgi:hypothetical protein
MRKRTTHQPQGDTLETTDAIAGLETSPGDRPALEGENDRAEVKHKQAKSADRSKLSKGGPQKAEESRDEKVVPLLRTASKVDWPGILLRACMFGLVVLLLYSKLGSSRQKAAETLHFVESFFEGPFVWSTIENKSDSSRGPEGLAGTKTGMELPKRKLGNTGLEVSILGFGASPLGNVFGDLNEADGIEAVHEAVRQGINFIDVSP